MNLKKRNKTLKKSFLKKNRNVLLTAYRQIMIISNLNHKIGSPLLYITSEKSG